MYGGGDGEGVSGGGVAGLGGAGADGGEGHVPHVTGQLVTWPYVLP